MRTACHAAGVEKAKGRALTRSLRLGEGYFASSTRPRSTWIHRKDNRRRRKSAGVRRRRVNEDVATRNAMGSATAREVKSAIV